MTAQVIAARFNNTLTGNPVNFSIMLLGNAKANVGDLSGARRSGGMACTRDKIRMKA